jgi:hypothetical protein
MCLVCGDRHSIVLNGAISRLDPVAGFVISEVAFFNSVITDKNKQ